MLLSIGLFMTPLATLLQGYKGALHAAKLDSDMAGKHNSSSCIAARTCQPLGSHSVWAALPAFPVQSAEEEGTNLPVVVVTAQADSTSFFHMEAQVQICYR